MNFEQLKELIEKIDASSLRSFELDDEIVSIKMSKNEGPLSVNEDSSKSVLDEKESEKKESPVSTDSPKGETDEWLTPNEEPSDLHEVVAPIVGTTYLSPSPDKPSFVEIGDKIKKGQALVIVEAMKVMNEIKSDVDGEVYDILVEDGQPIEFGQVLVKIKKS